MNVDGWVYILILLWSELRISMLYWPLRPLA